MNYIERSFKKISFDENEIKKCIAENKITRIITKNKKIEEFIKKNYNIKSLKISAIKQEDIHNNITSIFLFSNFGNSEKIDKDDFESSLLKLDSNIEKKIILIDDSIDISDDIINKLKIRILKLEDEDKIYSESDLLNNHITLIEGESGKGKTFFLKNLSNKDSKKYNYQQFKVIYDCHFLNSETNKDVEYFLIDALDEEKENDIYKKINEIITKNNKKIILTCRKGYLKDDFLSDWKIEKYELLPITKKQIDSILKDKSEAFWNFIKKSKLEHHLDNFVVLKELLENYTEYPLDTNISVIYKKLCCIFFGIQTENQNNYINEDYDILLEELSILMASKIFLKKEFPNKSLSLNTKIFNKDRKEYIYKLPIFSDGYDLYHKSLEEFLVAFYFHKKIQYNETTIKCLIKIFFNDQFIKREFKEILNFLIDLEGDDFKRIILEVNPLIMVGHSNCSDEIQISTLLKNIELLQEKPYFIYDNWDYYREYSKINSDLPIEDIINKFPKNSELKEETFSYLMYLLKNSDNRFLENYIFDILKERIKSHKDLRELLSGIFIHKIDFVLKLHKIIEKNDFKISEASYYFGAFLKILYENKKLSIIDKYILEIDEYTFWYIKDILSTKDLFHIFKNNIKNLKEDDIGKPIIEEVGIILLDKEDFKDYKDEYFDCFMDMCEHRSLYISQDYTNAIKQKYQINELLIKYFEKINLFLYIFSIEDITKNDIDNLSSKYPIDKFIEQYYRLYFLTKNEYLYNKIENKEYVKSQLIKVKEIEKSPKINIPLKESCEEFLHKNFQHNPYLKAIKHYDKMEVQDIIIEHFNNKSNLKIVPLDMVCLDFLNNITFEEINRIICTHKNKNDFFALILYFSNLTMSDPIIKFLTTDPYLEQKIIENFEKDTEKNILLEKNSYKIVENINKESLRKIIRKAENMYLDLPLNEFEEKHFLNILLQNSSNAELLYKKLKLKKFQLTSSFIKEFLKYYNINILLNEIDFDIDKTKFENTISLIKNENLSSLEEQFLKRFFYFYDKNYPDDEKMEYFDIDRFIYSTLIKIPKETLIKTILTEMKFKNKKLENMFNYYLKTILEKHIDLKDILDLITLLPDKDTFYFNYDAFFNNLIVLLNRLAELKIHLKDSKEDTINDFVRFGLEMSGYHVCDQRRGGISESGESPGERDLVIIHENITATILEALILNSLDKKNLLKHYKKLISKYDTSGNEINYLLTYYTGKTFIQFVTKYHNYFRTNLEIEIDFKECLAKENLKILKSTFERGRIVYHFLINLN